MDDWRRALRRDPLPWLLDGSTPAVRHRALVELLDMPADDPEVIRAQADAMSADPIAAILAAQEPEGWWSKPGAGYGPKYTGTVWQVIFLDQLGADPADPRVRAGCEYVLAHARSDSGGFAASGALSNAPPPPSAAIHCLHGNLLRAVIGAGFAVDERVQQAIEWQASAITGVAGHRFYRSGTTGPGFGCVANWGEPCAWGAVKAMSALARVPADRRTESVCDAIEVGVRFLLSRDPLMADYPIGGEGDRPSSSWFKLGFPLGYVADVLQNLGVLCELGRADDARLTPAIHWLLTLQDADGRWRNRYAYNGKTTVDIERQGEPSRWVTLRACRVLKAVAEAGALPG